MSSCYTARYFTEEWLQAPTCIQNNCYVHIPYKLFVTEKDVTRSEWSLRTYDEHVRLWVESTYHDNADVFAVTLCLYHAGFLKKDTSRMLFKIGKGNDGKGGEAMVEASLFGNVNFAFLDFGIFVCRQEMRTLMIPLNVMS